MIWRRQPPEERWLLNLITSKLGVNKSYAEEFMREVKGWRGNNGYFVEYLMPYAATGSIPVLIYNMTNFFPTGYLESNREVHSLVSHHGVAGVKPTMDLIGNFDSGYVSSLIRTYDPRAVADLAGKFNRFVFSGLEAIKPYLSEHDFLTAQEKLGMYTNKWKKQGWND